MINKPTHTYLYHLLIILLTREAEWRDDGGLVDDDLVDVLVDKDGPELLGQAAVKAGAADKVQTPLGAEAGVTLHRRLRGP